MRGYLYRDLGECSCSPFKRKEIAPAVLAAIIGAGATAATTVGNNIAASNLNAANRDFSREMAEKQNQFNAEQSQLAREQQSALLTQEQDWQEQMYNLYNSPSALMRQYRDAGMNPYLVDASHFSGASMTSPSAPSSPQAASSSVLNPQTYPMNYSGIGDSFMQAAGMYLQAKQVDANVANQTAKTLSEAADAYSKLRGHGMSHDDAYKMVAPYFKETQGFDANSDRFFGLLNLEYERNSIAKNYEQLQESIYREFGRTEKANDIMNKEQEFTVMAAQIGRLAVQNKLDESMIDKLASDIVRNFAAAGLDKANTDLIRQSMEFLVQSAQYEARLSWFKQASAEGEYNINKPKYDAAATELGQTVEVVDYYTDKVVDKVGKIMKVNLGVSKSSSTSRGYTNSWIWNGNQFTGGQISR